LRQLDAVVIAIGLRRDSQLSRHATLINQLQK